jgi:predicted lipoprotein with Yx(FWY)xxD motif
MRRPQDSQKRSPRRIAFRRAGSPSAAAKANARSTEARSGSSTRAERGYREIRQRVTSVVIVMHRAISLSALALVAALTLSACGSTSGHSKGGAGRPAATVSLASVSGVGKVLVDAKGFALYSPAQEKSGTIRCTGSCTAIWVPLTVKGSPTAASGLKLGTVVRPDGKTQVTFDGEPLYRFANDGSPRTVSGNGAKDSFGGKSFTWHVASPGKTSSSGGGGGYKSGY